MNLRTLENKSWVLEPISWRFSIVLPYISVSFLSDVCFCECEAGTVCLLSIVWFLEDLIFWKQM